MSSSFAYLSLPAAFSNSACDRVLQFDGSDVPPEIEALGPAERIFRPNPLGSTLVSCRYLFAFLLVASPAAAVAMIYLDLKHKDQLDQMASPGVWVGFGVIGAVCLAGAVWLARIKPTIATVFFYRQAAVIAEGDRLTLIPWQHLLWLPGRIFTSEGLEFRCGWMEEHDRFEEAVWERSAELWVPEALKKVRAGDTVTAGDLAVSATHIGCAGKTAAWDEVSKLIVIVGRLYQLSVFTSSWVCWAEVNLHKVPNARAMQQLIANICPSHLLQPAE